MKKIMMCVCLFIFLQWSLFALTYNESDGSEKTNNANPQVYADKLLSYENHSVEYIFSAKEGQDIVLLADYPDCSDCLPENVVFAFPDRERPFIGEKTYHIVTKEGEDLAVTFNFFENSELDTVKVDPPQRDENVEEVFSIVSKAGFVITVSVTWNSGKLIDFDISPKINPFGKQ